MTNCGPNHAMILGEGTSLRSSIQFQTYIAPIGVSMDAFTARVDPGRGHGGQVTPTESY